MGMNVCQYKTHESETFKKYSYFFRFNISPYLSDNFNTSENTEEYKCPNKESRVHNGPHKTIWFIDVWRNLQDAVTVVTHQEITENESYKRL